MSHYDPRFAPRRAARDAAVMLDPRARAWARADRSKGPVAPCACGCGYPSTACPTVAP